jgi:hypothetical protein
MANSNRMYPLDVIRRKAELVIDVMIAALPYVPTRDRTMWPAVMFAASRKDSVSGRTITLVDSIRTRNGFSQSGAPSGRKCAVDCLGACVNLEIIILNHSGNPIVSVIIRCLERLNVYGSIPIKLIAIRVMKIGAMIEDSPLRDFAPVRESWENMISSGSAPSDAHRLMWA